MRLWIATLGLALGAVAYLLWQGIASPRTSQDLFVDEPSDQKGEPSAITAQRVTEVPLLPPSRETSGSVNPRLKVLDASSRPVSGLELLLQDAAGSALVRTIEDGTCAAASGPARLFVSMPGRYPHSELLLRPCTPVCEVRLPRGAPIVGRVIIDGGDPRAPVELELSSSSGLLFDQEIVGLEAREYLRVTSNSGPERIELVTQLSGSFVLLDAPTDWEGWIRPKPPVFLLGGGESIRARAGVPVVIECTRGREYLGRVLGASTARPLADLPVSLELSSETGTLAANSRTDAQGVFRFTAASTDPASVTVRLPRGEPVEVPRAGIGLNGDLGTFLYLDPRATIEVLGTDRTPVEGAAVELGDRQYLADANGTVEVPIDGPIEADARIHAPGRKSARETLRLYDGARVVVELAPTNALELLVTDWAGRPVGGYGLRLPMAGLDPSSQRARYSIGAGATEAVYWTSDRGAVTLYGVPTDGVFGVEVVDPFGEKVCVYELLPLGEDERRTASLSVGATARTIEAVVRDPAGRPISGVEVLVGTKTGEGYGETGRDGAFRLERLHSDEVEVQLRRSGFVPREVVLRPGAGEKYDLQLEYAANLKVRLVTESEVPRGVVVRARSSAAGEFVRGLKTGPSTWMVGELLPGPVEVEVSVAGETRRWTGHTDEGEIVCPLPGLGELSVELDGLATLFGLSGDVADVQGMESRLDALQLRPGDVVFGASITRCSTGETIVRTLDRYPRLLRQAVATDQYEIVGWRAVLGPSLLSNLAVDASVSARIDVQEGQRVRVTFDHDHIETSPAK